MANESLAAQDEMDEIPIVDVTDELIGERREEWRAGCDAGRTMGVRSVLRAKDGGYPDGMTCVEQMAFDLKIHRVVVNGLLDAAEQRELLIQHLKNELQWWREEHTALQLEFVEYAKAVERKFCR